MLRRNIGGLLCYIESYYFATKMVCHVHTEYINVIYHFVCEFIKKVQILWKKIAIKDNLVDILTKVSKYNRCKNLMYDLSVK